MKTRTYSLISIAAMAFAFDLTAHADLKSDLDIQQLSGSLQITVKLSNTETRDLKLQLSNQALDLKLNQLSEVPQNDGTHSLTLKASSQGEITYSYPIDTTQNIFLTEDDLWYPSADLSNQYFNLKTNLQEGYSAIHSANGHQEPALALVLGKFTKYSSADSRLHIYLATPDAALAQTLLAKLSDYLRLYESKYGPYPYDDFSVVESQEEIGYAFPRMTWIGSELPRFPFILTSSLPHELLHSWWGNGVFVDYRSGNWCEGFTVFGADYGILSEADKKIYRLKALTNYIDYVKQTTEISLSQFQTRGEDPSLQAIGYDKAMMVLVMLEQEVGASLFQKAQQVFYQNFKYKTASYDDFFEILNQLSGKDLSKFKEFWINQKGLLSENFVKAALKADNGTALKWTGNSADLAKIPGSVIQAALGFQSGEQGTIRLEVNSDGTLLAQDQFSLNQPLLKYNLDPDFLLFRSLNPAERPVEFSETFGAAQVTLETQNSVIDGSLLTSLKQAFPNTTWFTTSTPVDYSQTGPVLISLTQALKDPKIVARLTEKKVQLNSNSLTVEGQRFDLTQDSFFATFRIQSRLVTVYQTNSSLSDLRWLQRWSHYGGNTYVVMTTTGAAIQGLWIDPYWISLNPE